MISRSRNRPADVGMETGSSKANPLNVFDGFDMLRAESQAAGGVNLTAVTPYRVYSIPDPGAGALPGMATYLWVYWNNINDAVISNYTYEGVWNTESDTCIYKLTGVSMSSGAFCDFNATGTQFWFADYTNDLYRRWDCSTAWDVSTATAGTTQATTILSEISTGTHWFFGNSGNHIFSGTTGTLGTLYRWALSTPYDLTTATSTADKSFTLTESGHEARILWMNSAGTRYYVESTSETIYEYTMSTPWDISTSVLSAYSLNCDTFGLNISDAREQMFTPDGKYMFFAYNTMGHWVIPLPTQGSLQNASTTELYKLWMDSPPTHPHISNWREVEAALINGLNYDTPSYHTTGKAFAMGYATSSPGIVDMTIVGDDMSTLTFVRETELWVRTDSPNHFYWREDGKVGLWHVDTTNGYDEDRNCIEVCLFPTAYNSSTIRWGAYYDPEPAEVTNWSMASVEPFIDAARFNPAAGEFQGGIAAFWIDTSGTHMFVTDGQKVHKYTLPYPWNPAIWTHAGTFDTGLAVDYREIEYLYCTPDGYYMCLVPHSDYDLVPHRCYRMSTPWDITTITGTWAAADRYLAYHLDFQNNGQSICLRPPTFTNGGRTAWIGWGDDFYWRYDF